MNKSYQSYLKSSDWKLKRGIKRKKRNNCAICSSKNNLDVHHLNYKKLKDVEQLDLRVLCRRCHFLAHDLIKQGKIKFKSSSHHSKFATLKNIVKRELNLSNKNLFLDHI